LGNNVNIHRFCYLDARGGIDIGDDVSIAHGCSLVAFDHSWDDRSKPIKYNPLVAAPIEIGSDVWLGCGVRVLSGVSIGKRSIIAAGAVVTKGFYEAGIFGGVPAKCLSELQVPQAEPEYSLA
jgi:acetyltransferase-like isoleucine patch superfamily enzyme